MVLGVIFLALSLMLMQLLYNQGQLVRHRVQLENAADATAYSVAKLGARRNNYSAYSNRSAVANELSVGQFQALLSWGKHYRDMGKFITFPAYQTPILPPSPVTFHTILQPVSYIYGAIGTAGYATANVFSALTMPMVTGFNTFLGLSEFLFVIATMEAQIHTHLELTKANQLNDDENTDIYPSFLSFFYLLNNIFSTYNGQNYISGETFANKLGVAGTETGDAMADYWPAKNAINVASPHGVPEFMGSEDNVVAAYQTYAAVVNHNRSPFAQDRHWDVGIEIPDIFPPINLGILYIDLDFSMWAGVKNDGVTVLASATGEFESLDDAKNLGWESMDMFSVGLEFTVGLYARIRIWLPFKGMTTIFEMNLGPFTLAQGFPLGGATHQQHPTADAKKILTDWGDVPQDDGPYGGDPDDDVNDGPQEMFHMTTLGWGQTLGIYGGPGNVTSKAAFMPPLLYMDDHIKETSKGYEYTVALAIDLDQIETTDTQPFNIAQGNDAQDWVKGNEEDITFDRFDLTSCARAEEGSVEGLYQRGVWHSSNPMTTISSAEVYFDNPMQDYEDGSSEYANLYSPFWDARLIQPTKTAMLIATGEVDYDDIFGESGENVPNDAIGIVRYMMNKYVNGLIDSQQESLLSNFSSPVDGFLQDATDPLVGQAKGASGQIIDAVTDELGEFVGNLRTEPDCQS